MGRALSTPKTSSLGEGRGGCQRDQGSVNKEREEQPGRTASRKLRIRIEWPMSNATSLMSTKKRSCDLAVRAGVPAE